MLLNLSRYSLSAKCFFPQYFQHDSVCPLRSLLKYLRESEAGAPSQSVLHSPLRVTAPSGVGLEPRQQGAVAGVVATRPGVSVRLTSRRCSRGPGVKQASPCVPVSLGLTAGCGSLSRWPVMQDTSRADPLSTLTNQTDVRPQRPPWWRRVRELASSASWKPRPSGREGPTPGQRDSKPGLGRATQTHAGRAAAGPRSAFGDSSPGLAAPPRALSSRSG